MNSKHKKMNLKNKKMNLKNKKNVENFGKCIKNFGKQTQNGLKLIQFLGFWMVFWAEMEFLEKSRQFSIDLKLPFLNCY